VGGTLYKATDPDAPLEDVMQALATEAKSKQRTVAVIDDTATHYRIVGWGYTPQGYKDTPNGPKLWLLCLEGATKFRP
jgi:hypothetical protein